jgi:hypothetical protein
VEGPDRHRLAEDVRHDCGDAAGLAGQSGASAALAVSVWSSAICWCSAADSRAMAAWASTSRRPPHSVAIAASCS